MTAWTAIVIPTIIVAKCALDFIGMEYGSQCQCLTDKDFFFVVAPLVVFGVTIDLLNMARKKI